MMNPVCDIRTVYTPFSALFRHIFASAAHVHSNDRQDNKRRRNIKMNKPDRVAKMARQMMEEIDQVAATPEVLTGEACYEMGLAFSSGRSQPVDLVAAHKWFNVALMQGYREASARRSEVASEMTTDEIAEALREARALITRH